MVNLSGDNIDPTLLFHTFNEIKSLYVNRKHVLGNETIIQTLDDLKFHVSLDSFFQVNTQQTENLYHQITKFLNPKRNERVLDLYCGVGSIALMVAKHATNVIGVEINQTAVEDANKNKELNKITNVDFICDDATSFLNKFNESIDVVIVDPPRKGLTKQGIEDIIKTKAQKVIYVSCNPITLKRDLEILSVYYQVDEIVPFDMFPQTVHVECIALIQRVNS